MHRRTLTSASAIVVAAAALATGCGSGGSSSTSDGTIHIADIQPLTGASGQYGRQALQGAQVAVEVINKAGGVLGKKLKLISADDASTSTQSVSLMQKYGSDKSTLAIIGPTYSSDFVADAPFAEKYGVVTISSGSTAPWKGKFNKWTFRSSVPGSVYLPQLVDSVVKNGNVKSASQVWAIDNEALAAQGKLLDDVFPDHGVKVRVDQKANNATTDFSSQITAVMKSPPDLVTIGLITNGAALLTQQMRSAGYRGLFMADGNTLLDPVLYSQSHGAADGLIVPSSFDANSTDEKVQAFVTAYKAKFGEVPNAQEAFGYDAVGLLADAMKRAKSTTDRDAVRKAMGETSNYQGVQGPFTFDGSGDNTTPTVHVLQLTETGFVPYPRP